MDDDTWAVIVDPATDPQVRRDMALQLLVDLAGAYDCADMKHVDGCEAVIKAEFEYADRLAGR